MKIGVIGGGLVGLATAYQIMQKMPQVQLKLFEKERAVSLHQSGRNSGVLHSGIYYPPGSSKAINCIRGKKLMETFCQEEGITFRSCGKVIVATKEQQLPLLKKLFEQGQAHQIPCRWLDKEQLKEREPFVEGVAAVLVENAGIIHYPDVAKRLSEKLQLKGAEIALGKEVLEGRWQQGQMRLITTDGEEHFDLVVNCAGLYCDQVAKKLGGNPTIQIVPFRGEYYKLRPEAAHYCQTLIYPVPDPNFPFLGVHFTRMIDDTVECGPNAVLAYAREGYSHKDFSFKELYETLVFPGFWPFAKKHWKMGLQEVFRSLSKKRFTASLQELIPAVRREDLLPAEAGVRAQAMYPDGRLVTDFLIERSPGAIHLLNAPSPAATSSLSIGETIVQAIAEAIQGT